MTSVPLFLLEKWMKWLICSVQMSDLRRVPVCSAGSEVRSDLFCSLQVFVTASHWTGTLGVCCLQANSHVQSEFGWCFLRGCRCETSSLQSVSVKRFRTYLSLGLRSFNFNVQWVFFYILCISVGLRKTQQMHKHEHQIYYICICVKLFGQWKFATIWRDCQRRVKEVI